VFSRLPFAEPTRTAWAECHGVTDSFFDCLTPKGLLRTSVELSPGLALDVYDVHLDAGWSPADRLARAAQLEQLTRAIRNHSTGRAVLVAGDFNLSPAELDALDRLESEAGVRDVCRALGCSEPRRIDRILFRSSAALELAPTAWRAERGFVDAQGRPLSDHAPVAVTFRWTARRSRTSQAVR
jgi:endonuclease/exonuclease/phosphatase family metal-dependent hydrolase